MNKIILDLCGGTGAWSKPYKDASYDVRVITYPEFDVNETDLNEHGITFYEHVNRGALHESRFAMKIQPTQIYGILAAPPCTMFSLARRTAKTSPDFDKAMLVVRACMEIIWFTRVNNDNLKFWALENPLGLLRQFLGIPHYTFEQWWFGDDGIKRTDLWGYFKEPKRLKEASQPTTTKLTWQRPPKPEAYKDMKLDRAAIRAITPQGFAQAFFKANK